MRTNRRAFTLVELMIATLVIVSVVMGFYHVIRGTSVFVAANKQELLVFRTVSSIRNEIETAFRGGGYAATADSRERLSTTLLPPPYADTASGSIQDRSATGAYSYKDDIGDEAFGGHFDVVAIEYEDAFSSGGTVTTETGTIVVGVVDKKTRRLIDPAKKRPGFLAIEKLDAWTDLKDYYEWSSNTGAIFDDRVFDDVNALGFEFRIIEKGSLMRLDFLYDNDLDEEFVESKQYDESYLSGSTFVVIPVNFK